MRLQEFCVGARGGVCVEQALKREPRPIGFGVCLIWDEAGCCWVAGACVLVIWWWFAEF